jgi:hypothetical protein
MIAPKQQAFSPTPNNCNKLPKWAQDYIQKVERQRDAAVDALNNFVNEQTPTNVYIEENPCTGEGTTGPICKIRYLQVHAVTFKLGKEEITVRHKFDSPGLQISAGWSRLCIRPEASNCIEIIEEKR